MSELHNGTLLHGAPFTPRILGEGGKHGPCFEIEDRQN
jgi:hypothetical protein